MNGSLDELDQNLLKVLGKDARVSNRKIADSLGITEGTVRSRIKRLKSEGLIAFTAVTGLPTSTKPRLAFIGIKVEVSQVREVADHLTAMDEIQAVLVSLSEFNVTAVCLFNDIDELSELTSDRILTFSGIHQIETTIAVQTFKYNTRVARITEFMDDEV